MSNVPDFCFTYFIILYLNYLIVSYLLISQSKEKKIEITATISDADNQPIENLQIGLRFSTQGKRHERKRAENRPQIRPLTNYYLRSEGINPAATRVKVRFEKRKAGSSRLRT